jgi:hypothetical protein
MVVQLLGDRGLEIAELVLLILRQKVASRGNDCNAARRSGRRIAPGSGDYS